MLIAPALDDYFFVGVELDGVATLRVHVAEEAALPAGEGEVSHGGSYADVNADVACGRFVAEAARGRSAGSEQGSLVAERAALKEGDGLVHVTGVNQAQHGAENFRVRQFTGGGNAVQNCWLQKISDLRASGFWRYGRRGLLLLLLFRQRRSAIRFAICFAM